MPPTPCCCFESCQMYNYAARSIKKLLIDLKKAAMSKTNAAGKKVSQKKLLLAAFALAAAYVNSSNSHEASLMKS